MTHLPGVPLQGELGTVTTTDRKCSRCREPMTHQTWESSCGGYQDSKYICPNDHVDFEEQPFTQVKPEVVTKAVRDGQLGLYRKLYPR